MRMLFLLLVLANLAFFAWDRYLRVQVDAGEHIRQVQIMPEKIRMLTNPAQPVAATAAVRAEPAKAAAACLEFGAFIGNEATRADAALAELKLPAGQVRRVASDMNGHWVLIPPFNTRAEAEKFTERLKGLGVTDFSFVNDAPLRRNAISLGIFRTEEGAQNLLAGLRKRGVKEAVIEVREGFFRRVVYYVREPDPASVAKLTTLRENMPGTEVKAVACPAP